MPTNAEYTYLSSYRQGLANFITDTSGKERASISLKLKLKDVNNPINKTAQLYGPGDVTGLNPKAIIRVEPTPGSTDFEANYLPFIEFYDEDLPWRYSPDQSGEKTMPWLALIVLKKDEFSFSDDNNKPLPYIVVDANAPVFEANPLNNWAFAHVQVNAIMSSTDEAGLTAELKTILDANPDQALSRVMSFRKLEPETNYTAFLVPVFETGRKAGLGEETKDISAMDFSWPLAVTDLKFPFYHQYSFSTGSAGDFETLARKLAPGSTAVLKVNTIDVSDLIEELKGSLGGPKVPDDGNNELTKLNPISGQFPGFRPTTELEIGSVLMPPLKSITAWPGNKAKDKAIRDGLRSRINEGLKRGDDHYDLTISSDPIINQPQVYGRWHAGISEITSSNPTWVRQINLDPRLRVAAAIGAEVVKKNQEAFMDFAWDQVGAIEEANKEIRLLQMAKTISKRIAVKHIDDRDKDDLLTLTSNLHSKIKSQGMTLSKEVDNSKLTKAATNTAFKKMIRPAGKLFKKIKLDVESTSPPLNSITAELNSDATDVSAAKEKNTPYGGGINDNYLKAVPDYSNSPRTVTQNEMETFSRLYDAEDRPLDSGGATSQTLDDKKNDISTAINPEETISVRVFNRLEIPNNAADRFSDPQGGINGPIMAAPKFPHPLYDYLKALNPQFILPGADGIENNTVTLLVPNQKFIESFLVGANHELSRELLWREYPADQRGTYFNNFWNKEDYLANVEPANEEEEQVLNFSDIPTIDSWSNGIGNNGDSNSPSIGLVLVLRGDLFRKFPNVAIYAQKAESPQSLEDDNVNKNVKYPILYAKLGSDLNIVGFELTVKEATGEDSSDHGWFFMFKERAGEVRFGLDDGTATALDTWDDLGWGDMAGDDFINPDLSISPTDGKGVSWGQNAAQMAHILYQVPVAFGIHASDFLDTAN